MEPGKRSSIEWMYEGQSSKLHQEEFLCGKKVDKNFDRFHGEEPSQQNKDGIEAVIRRERTPPTTGLHGTMLDLRTVKNEDPLVAIKVKEEKIRSEILHNPLQMKRLQKLVAKEMEKKMKKMSKHSKKSRSRSRSPQAHRRHSNEKYDRHSRSSHQNRSREEERHLRKSSPPPNSSTREHHHEKPHHDHGGREEERRRKVDYSDSDSDNERKRKKYSGYGLITSKTKSNNHEHSGREEVAKDRSSVSKTKHSVEEKTSSKPDKKHKLTEEEKEKRRRPLDNANWRDKQREGRIQLAAEREKREAIAEAHDKRKKGSDFIRPMLSAAMDTGSLEQRIKSNIFSVDRRSKAMNSNFVKK